MPPTPGPRTSGKARSTRPPAHGFLATMQAPMAIPQTRDSAPPPLPPPTYIPDLSAGQDSGWQWGNNPVANDFGRAATVKAGSSLLGGGSRNAVDEQPHPSCHRRRDSSLSTVTTLTHDSEMHEDGGQRSDEGQSPRPSPNAELTGERDLRRREIELSSQSYDKQLVNRIGGPNTPKRQSLSYTSGGGQETGPLGPNNPDSRKSPAWSVSMPERRHLSVDSNSMQRPPFSSAFSGQPSPRTEHGTFEYHGTRTYDSPGSLYGNSCDQLMFMNDAQRLEDSHMSGLNLHDQNPTSPKAGSKRRASSPPRERGDRSSSNKTPGQTEWPDRPALTSISTKASPISRFHPNFSAVSPASSVGPRHGSLGSSVGVPSIPSSATSYASGRLSPSLLSTAPDPDMRGGLLSGTGPAMGHAAAAINHHRTLSEITPPRKSSTDSAFHSRSGSLSQMQTTYVCECCPKKPRKFDSEEALKHHENEKQYTCAYCKHRFKNKNEAERHQNSLHLRQHSWSCSALNTVETAFHPSSSADGSDMCGYCGLNFANPPQWALRAEHLHHVHKFGECNQTKKFFRADHFRQHLKHSHHGTGGKWTNILESACMKEEPVPEKRRSSGAVAAAASAGNSPPGRQATNSGLSGGGPAGPDTIDETPHDC